MVIFPSWHSPDFFPLINDLKTPRIKGMQQKTSLSVLGFTPLGRLLPFSPSLPLPSSSVQSVCNFHSWLCLLGGLWVWLRSRRAAGGWGILFGLVMATAAVKGRQFGAALWMVKILPYLGMLAWAQTMWSGKVVKLGSSGLPFAITLSAWASRHGCGVGDPELS